MNDFLIKKFAAIYYSDYLSMLQELGKTINFLSVRQIYDTQDFSRFNVPTSEILLLSK